MTAWVSAPARAGTSRARSSRVQASCSASWNRWPSVRSSSGPAFLPSASRTARTAVAHSGVRSPRITPASPNVVPSWTYRSPGSGSSASGCCARQVSIAHAAMVARSSVDAPAAAASSRMRSVSSRICAGSLRVQSAMVKAREPVMSPAASAASEQRALAELAHLPDRGPGVLPRSAGPSRPATAEDDPYPSASWASAASNRRSRAACAAVSFACTSPRAISSSPQAAPSRPATAAFR